MTINYPAARDFEDEIERQVGGRQPARHRRCSRSPASSPVRRQDGDALPCPTTSSPP